MVARRWHTTGLDVIACGGLLSALRASVRMALIGSATLNDHGFCGRKLRLSSTESMQVWVVANGYE